MEKEQSAIICPFDKNHIIHKSRIQRHLLKCSRNYPPNYMATCPYNATHLMFESELASHLEQCSDRRYIDAERCQITMRNHGSFKPCPPSKAELCVDIYSDIWEDSEIRSNDFTSNASVVSNTSTLVPPRNEKINRFPQGYSEVMMLELTEGSEEEDVESVTSSMGRGKFIHLLSRKRQNLPKVGRGRGYFIDELKKVGQSATSDVEDLESVTYSVGCDGRNDQIYVRNPEKFGRDYAMENANTHGESGHGHM